MRGRKPKPSALAELHGQPGKRPRKIGEPKPPRAPAAFDPPRHLSSEARDEWRRIVADLSAIGMLTTIDRTAIAAYCTLYARWAKAEIRIQETAELIRTPNNHLQQSPWIGISNRALELMHRYLIEFGMTPSSRVRLATPAPPRVDSPDDREGTNFADDLSTFLDQHPDRRIN